MCRKEIKKKRKNSGKRLNMVYRNQSGNVVPKPSVERMAAFERYCIDKGITPEHRDEELDKFNILYGTYIDVAVTRCNEHWEKSFREARAQVKRLEDKVLEMQIETEHTKKYLRTP